MSVIITDTCTFKDVQSSVANIPARFGEWLTEILRHHAILEWAAEHYVSDSQNLEGIV